MKKYESVISPTLDFWLFGGASLLFFLVMCLAKVLGGENEVLQQRFLQIPVAFALLSLVCNHPHFLSSYKLAYGRGLRFIFQNPVSLVIVPLGLVCFYFIGFRNYNVEIGESNLVVQMNQISEGLGIGFNFGSSLTLGPELIGLSIWLMYLTVGWHYSKQVFGVVLIQAAYANYTVSPFQKTLLKMNVSCIAIYQFLFMAKAMGKYSGSAMKDPRFGGIELSKLVLPEWAFELAKGATGISLCLVIVFWFGRNWINQRAFPNLNILTPLVAFHIWWVPLLEMPEYYLVMIPFFHSLQYLPFVYRVEDHLYGQSKYKNLKMNLSFLLIGIAGFLFFEMIPLSIDKYFETSVNYSAWIFVTMFAVFINIHHFFIDSVIWKFHQPEIRGAFFKN